jgi:EmrB/QacA subfamily drug resistance transporter
VVRDLRRSSGGHRARWLVEPARPDWVRNRRHAPYYALAAVCIGAFMGQLDASIVTVAFPTLQHVFRASLGSVTWVGLSYLVTLVAGVTAVGRLADMVGRKLLYTYGFVVFILGSGLCALAPDLLSLDAFRVLQAVGAAMLQANSVAIIYLVMPEGTLGRGIGVQGAAQALGLALGPSIGGLLLAAGGWRLIFFVNVPAGVLGTIAAFLFLPRSAHLQARVPFDWAGLGCFVLAIVALLVAVSFANSWGWGSARILGLLALSVVATSCFALRERRARHPMLDLGLFRRIRFTAGIASGLCSYLVLFGVLFAVPFFLERARGASADRAGLELTALPLALGIVAPFAGKLADRVGARPLTVSGMALTALFLGALGLGRPEGAFFLLELAGIGFGLGCFTPPNNAAIMAAAPKEQAGVASGVLNMTRGSGTSLGLALTSFVLGAIAGHGVSGSGVPHGFEAAALFLGGVSLLAALLAAARGRAPVDGQLVSVAALEL